MEPAKGFADFMLNFSGGRHPSFQIVQDLVLWKWGNPNIYGVTVQTNNHAKT